MLKLIIGRAYSGKTTKILEKIKNNIENNFTSYVMVPEQLTLETEKMFISAIKKPLFLCKIMSFDRLSADVIGKVGGVKKEYIDDIGKVMLIENILLEHRDELMLYKNAVNKIGFIENIIKLLTELKKYEVCAYDLEEFAKGDIDNILREKLTEIAKIQSLLEEKLEGKFVDNESRLSLLCEKIPSYTKIRKFEVFFDNFVSFTMVELKVIKTLLDSGVDVTVTLACDDTNDDRDDSFVITRNTYNQLKNLANGKVEEEFLFDTYDNVDELRHLENNFGKSVYEVYKDETKNISLLSTDTADTEVQKVADEINYLVRNKGYRYSDIAVVLSSQLGYEKLIRDVFSRYDIPFFVDSKREITGENLVSLVFSLLDMYSTNINYVNIMSFFKSGLTQKTKKEYENLENHMIKWNIHTKKYINKIIFSDKYFFGDIKIKDIDEDKKAVIDEIEKNKEEICNTYNYIKDIYKKYKTLRGENKVSKISETIKKFLNDIGIEERLNEVVEEQKILKNYEIAGEISQTYNILIETIGKIDMLVEDYTVSTSFYKKMLYQGLNAQKIALIPPTIDTVMVMDIQRSKSLGYKALFILGMNDTLLPNIKKDGVILSENDKKAMISIGIKNTVNDVISQEKMAMYIILSRAREKIYLSYPMTDINCMGSEKSSYIVAMNYIFPKMTKTYISADDVKKLTNITGKVAFDNMRASLLSMIENRNEEDTKENEKIIKKYKYFAQNDVYKQDINIMKKSIFAQNEYENIDKKYVRKLYNRTGETNKVLEKSSVSQIECYNTCPFLYFMRYGVKPKKRETISVDALESGNIMHKYMERLSKDVLKKDKKEVIQQLVDDKEKIKDLVKNIYDDDEFLKENIKLLSSNSNRQQYIIDRLKKISEKSTIVILEQQLSTSFETKFSELSIKREIYGVTFVGAVDRVDVLNTKDDHGKNLEYAQIIDYKSRERKIDLEKVYNGLDLQMLFYLYVLTDETDKKPYSALYFPMVDTIVGIEADGDDIKEKIKTMDISENMKLNGIIIEDEKLLDKFENGSKGKKIKYAKVSIYNKISEEQMKILLNKVVELIKQSVDKIISGNIKPEPVKDACNYCEYKNMCRFDKSVSGYNEKKIVKLKNKNKKDAFFEKLKEGEKDGEN